MPKYAVTIKGTGYRVEFEETELVFFKKKTWRRADFTATRYVETDTPARAADLAIEMIKYEIIKGFRETEDAMLSLHEIHEDPAGFDQNAPGKGFTFTKP